MQSRRSLAFLLLIFVAGIIFTKVVGVGFVATNDMEFCTSCHSMKVNLEEYKKTVHYKNASGVRATCADCHVPKPLVPAAIAKIVASRDIISEIVGTIDTKEKYEQHRWEMASRVWAKMEASDSRECRDCHDYTHMDLSEQQRIARKRHNKAVDQGKTCIDCHKGIAHEEPDEPEGEE